MPDAVIIHKGRPGVWFDVDVSRCLLRDVKTLRLVKTKVRLLDKSLSVRERKNSLLRKAYGQSVRQAEALEDALAASESRARKAERRQRRSKRVAIFAFIGGTVIGVIAATLALVLVGGQ